MYFLMLPFLLHKIFTFYINGVLNWMSSSRAKGLMTHYVMPVYGERVWLKVWIHALTSATGADQVPAWSSGHSTTGSHWIWKWIGPRVGLLTPSGIKLKFRGLTARSLLSKLLYLVTWYFPWTYDGFIAPSKRDKLSNTVAVHTGTSNSYPS